MKTAPLHRGGEAGITLVEMLVALAIFALIGVASYTTLETILRVRERTDGRLEALARLDRALTVFSRDIAQADPATVRLSSDGLSAVLGDNAGLRQYRLAEDVLIRQSGNPQETDVSLDQPLVPAVAQMRLRILDAAGTWHVEWPAEGQGDPVPRGVELELEFDSGSTLRRTVALPDLLLE